jgi:hypothetical protein
MTKGRTRPHEDDVKAKIEDGQTVAMQEVEDEGVEEKKFDNAELYEEASLWGPKDCGIGWEYFWNKDGKFYRYYISGESVGLKIETSSEYNRGERRFWYKFRGLDLIDTNDARRKKEVVPDAGPQVWIDGPSGTKVVSVDQFLSMINENKAKRRWMTKRTR